MLKIKKSYPMSMLTTLKIGGPAKYFVEVKNRNELVEAIKFAKKEKTPYLIIGGGSNLLVSDQGFNGLLIKNMSAGIINQDGIVTVNAGTKLQALVDFTAKNGLGGMNKMIGIPGTVGGAVYGNAGAYDQTISDYITQIKTFNPTTYRLSLIAYRFCNFSYRSSIFKKNHHIILGVTFKLPKADKKTLMQTSAEVLAKRLAKYPPHLKSPGSFFKNIVADKLSKDLQKKLATEIIFGKIPAGRLIELVAGKGDRLGNIMIAENHGNTFINLGGGTAKDFYNLAQKYYRKVKKKFGIKLEPEVQLINLPPLH